MQTSYSENFRTAAFPGQLADSGPHDVRSGQSMQGPAKSVTPTPANSTAYTLSFTEPDGTHVTATYTSDSTATAAEIDAGLLAAVAVANPTEWYAVMQGAVLLLVPKPGVSTPTAAPTSTGAGTLTIADLDPSILFGSAVALDSSADAASNQIMVPAASTDVIIGVALSTHALEQLGRFDTNPTGAPKYRAGDVVNVCRFGRVWVTAEETTTKGDQVYVRYSANGAKIPGGFGSTSDSGKNAVLSGARWLDSAAAGELARIQFNLAT